MPPLKIGPYHIHSIETGSFALDGGAMFGIVPKTIWERSHPADEKNRIDMRARAMLLQKPADTDGPARNILVDTGMGHKWAEKYEKIYKVDYSQWTLEKSLKEKGLKCEDITDVIMTHLHFDHSGGLTRIKTGEKDPIPTFPNARVYVQRRNWELAWDPTEKDQASYLSENYAPYQRDFKNQLELLETPSIEPTGKVTFQGPDAPEEEVLPGVSVQMSNGHTLGMQLVRVADGQQSITYCADLIPTSSHVRVPFIMSYDCFPMFILKEKKKLLERTVEESGYLFYEHCPHMAASRVSRTDKGDFVASEKLEL